jgi:hypothetical protein
MFPSFYFLSSNIPHIDYSKLLTKQVVSEKSGTPTQTQFESSNIKENASYSRIPLEERIIQREKQTIDQWIFTYLILDNSCLKKSDKGREREKRSYFNSLKGVFH